MNSLLRATCCTLLVLAACGGKKPVVANAPSTDIGDGGADADTATADSSGGGDGGSSGSSGASEAASPPALLSCVAAGSCTEMTVGGKDAADAKDRCKAASGESKDAACSKDDVIATCALPKDATLYHYKGKTPAETKGRLKGGESSCKTAGGTWALAAKPAAKPPGKKTPAKKP